MCFQSSDLEGDACRDKNDRTQHCIPQPATNKRIKNEANLKIYEQNSERNFLYLPMRSNCKIIVYSEPNKRN